MVQTKDRQTIVEIVVIFRVFGEDGRGNNMFGLGKHVPIEGRGAKVYVFHGLDVGEVHCII